MINRILYLTMSLPLVRNLNGNNVMVTVVVIELWPDSSLSEDCEIYHEST